MNAQDCLNILREVKDCAFATVNEKGEPEVRIIDVMIVENEKLYFCTARGKHFYEQLQKGPVAITGLNKNWQSVRLKGTCKKVKNQKKWIDRIFDENPSMNDIYPKDSRSILDVFVIEDGTLEFFDLSQTPIYRESFVIGQAAITPKGFHIGDDCIGCGTCAEICPQHAIVGGSPFKINQSSCLHCGLCFENCPVQCIEKL